MDSRVKSQTEQVSVEVVSSQDFPFRHGIDQKLEGPSIFLRTMKLNLKEEFKGLSKADGEEDQHGGTVVRQTWDFGGEIRTPGF